ncbi:hypothetical protein QQS21_009910 [Conoideocrella luteorostrata]|uniref:Zn(2)-C6 fungal-type domain-containing protein n=1 Tax=Conoideocrella luteorostrata TaxID=1105319 RepID=A0AAJ0FPW8_9HYPO|nr:hypothetical protein QQS21_009910 [Conoideocrella luteorostrata]
MPPKRRAGGTTASSNDQEEGERPKKRRVSLACDACRAAREKCDGARPQCGTCVAQDRSCSYTPATKKRGIQTGYLRTVELSLAWLFDQMPECEQSLYQILNQSGASQETRALLGKGRAGHHLQRVWNETRVRKAMDALLSSTQHASPDNSGNESDAEGDHLTNARDTAASLGLGMARAESRATSSLLRGPELETATDKTLWLPVHWERLLNVYISYTHCWLPIVHPDALRSLAASYGPQGLTIDSDAEREAYSLHAELWAALAIASFQDMPLPDERRIPSHSAPQIFRIAQGLMPGDDGTFDIHSISAIVLHAVIFIGRGKAITASLLLGKAARLLQQTQPTLSSVSQDRGNFAAIRHDTVALACSSLDTLTSLFLNQHSMAEFCSKNTTTSRSITEFSGFDQVWQSIPAENLTLCSRASMQPTMEPIKTLVQLHEFTSVLSSTQSSMNNKDASTRPAGPEDLVLKLDHRFNFCNSLISSGSTPMIPSAYLVKLLFLTATIELASHLRSSLLSGFLEMVESCFANFGAGRTPPLVTLLLQLVQRRAKVDDMSEPDRPDWRLAVEKLQVLWQDGPECSVAPSTASVTGADEFTQRHEPQHRSFIPMSAVPGRRFNHPSQPSPQNASSALNNLIGDKPDAQPSLQNASSALNNLIGDKPDAQPSFGYQNPVPNPAFELHVSPFTTQRDDGRAVIHPTFSGGHRINENFDYDALFEDLGSLGCTDNLEMDTRFMTNLGFAPGCDLAEIFQGDFGV